jgi:hypothetical protein
MGMRATFRVIPGDLFQQKQKQPVVPHDAPRFDLDKTWLDFHWFARKQPKPMSYLIKGNRSPHGSLDRSDGLYVGYVTPAVVKKLALLIEELSVEQVFEMSNPQWSAMSDREQESYRWSFQQLKDAYRLAANEKAGLMILIC